MSEVKALSGVEIKSEAHGQVTVRFATYDELDLHGDITRKGAFEDGREVVVSSYNHTSWGGALPVGKGRIRDGVDGAYADLQFLMNTQAGRDTFETVKEMGSLQQWSYGFDIEKKSETKSEDGEPTARVLEKVRVHEISPVLLGAGKSTATVSVKTLDDLYELFEEKAKGDKKPKPKDEDEDKKDPKDSKKPKDDEDEDEDEDDKKPSARKKPSGSGKMRMSDQTDDVVTSIQALADRAEEIVALRKSEGKSGVSLALREQFDELFKQADRIYELTKDDESEHNEMQHIYLSLLSEEL